MPTPLIYNLMTQDQNQRLLDAIEDLCEDYLPNLLNPMMSTEEVKQRLGVSDATLNRMVARGELPNGQSKRRGHTRYWKKWDILSFVRGK